MESKQGDSMNLAHRESLELLEIVHQICKENDIKYTLSAASLIAYENNMDFEQCVPIIYISLFYREYKELESHLKSFVEHNKEFSYHNYYNTEQMDGFESWFVKEPKIVLSEGKKKESFYYGTRLVITPLFYVGDTEEEWDKAYSLFKDTTCTMNARAVLTGKPLKSYIKLTPKRRISNYYIKKRGVYTYERCIKEYGDKLPSKYVVLPFVVGRNDRNINSVPWIVNENSKKITQDIWRDVEEITLYGVQCYCVKNREICLCCYPDHYVKNTLDKNKSHLALNGNTYLWRVQQIQVELLKEFDRICREHGINYNISFGTLLGAVRHKGFIPWDDDIDVTLCSEDFDRLDEIMKKELDDEKYYFRCPANEENNHLIFKHLERKGTIYTKPGRNKLTQEIGVFIDVFPMYPSAHFMLSDWIHAKICRYWRTALWATIGADSEKDEKKRKKYKKMAKPGNKVCYERFVRAANFFKNSKYLKFWIAMDRNPYKVPLVRASNYVDTIDMEFEGYKFMAPRNYEEILDYCFGKDWRKYPSLRGRVASHKAIMEIGDLYLNESEGKS